MLCFKCIKLVFYTYCICQKKAVTLLSLIRRFTWGVTACIGKNNARLSQSSRMSGALYPYTRGQQLPNLYLYDAYLCIYEG